MPEYGYMDDSIIGLVQGLDADIEGQWCAKEFIVFGRPVFGYINDDNGLYNYKNDVALVLYDADFVTSNSIAFSVNGVAITPVVFTTDHDTTAGLLVAAVAGLTGVECVLDSGDVTNRTFLVRVKVETALVTTTVTLGGSQAGETITYHNGQVFVGVSTFFQNSSGLYEDDDPVSVLVKGSLTVAPILAAEALQDAFVHVTADSDIGQFSNAGMLVGARYRASGAADALLRLEVISKTEGTYAGRF